MKHKLLLFFSMLMLACTGAWAQNVARIGTTEYAAFATAVDDATDGQTITLLADLENTGNVSLKAGVTLDGGNHKISFNSAIYINAAGGTVKNVVFENIHNSDNKLSAVYASNLTGTASITGCSFDNCDWDAIQITPIEGCTISIIDNTFRHTNTTTSQLRYVHIESSVTKSPYTSAKITVTDNKFYNTKAVGVGAINNIGAYYISYAFDNPYKTKYSGNWFETIENCDINNGSTNYSYYVYPARSQADVDVDDRCPAARSVVKPFNYYYTLKEAFESGNDIMLMKNTDEDVTVPVSYNKQLQTDGFNINSTITNNGSLYIIASTSDDACTGKVINNGSLKNSNLASLNGLQIVNNGKFEITGSTNAADLATITNNESGIIEISGGTFSSKPNDEWILWGYEAVDNGDGTFTVKKRTFADDAKALAAGAVARCTSSSNVFKDYINTLANGGTNYLHFLTDISEDVIRTGTTYLCADNFKYTGSLDATNQTVYVKSGKAEFNNLNCKAFNVGATKTEGVEVIVHDGKVTGKITVYSPAVLKIDGGTFTNTSATVNSGATLVIIGGTFNSAQFKNYIAAGYVAEDNGDGTYTVKFGATTQKNGETEETHNVQIGNDIAPVANITLTEVKDMVTAAKTQGNNITAVNLTGLNNIKEGATDATVAEIHDAVKTATGTANAIVILNESYKDEVGENTNIVIKNADNSYTCNQLVLTDGADFASPVNFTANYIAPYTRTSANTWGTLCLPYEIYSNNDDITYYVIDDQIEKEDGAWLVLKKVEYVAANTPCIYKNKNNTSEPSFIALGSEINIAGSKSDQQQIYTLHGTLSTIQLTEGTDGTFYFIKDDQFHGLNDGAILKVKAFRAYLTANGINNARTLGIMVDDEELTGVEAAEVMEALGLADGKYIENGKIVIVKNGQKYNLNGTK